MVQKIPGHTVIMVHQTALKIFCQDRGDAEGKQERQDASRIKALLRRSAGFSQSVFLEANGIKVDLMERLVWKNGVLLDLPLVEYRQRKSRPFTILIS